MQQCNFYLLFASEINYSVIESAEALGYAVSYSASNREYLVIVIVDFQIVSIENVIKSVRLLLNAVWPTVKPIVDKQLSDLTRRTSKLQHIGRLDSFISFCIFSQLQVSDRRSSLNCCSDESQIDNASIINAKRDRLNNSK
jgi:hypothetical protein